MSTLITEAKYIAFRQVAREAISIKRFINKLEFNIMESFILFGNNEMSIALIKNIES